MSYLETLMKTDPIEEKSCFVKSKEEDCVIVPNVNNSEDKPSPDYTHKSSSNYENKYQKISKPFKNNNSLRKEKESSYKNSERKPRDSNYSNSERKPRDSNYTKAFEQAMNTLREECRPNKDDDAIISQSIQYIHNWNGIRVKVDVSTDSIVVNLDDKDYTFSKKRFLENRNFQRNIIDDYAQAYGNVYIKFYQLKNDNNNHIIHVKSGR